MKYCLLLLGTSLYLSPFIILKVCFFNWSYSNRSKAHLEPTVMFIIYLEFMIFDQILLSAQLKPCAIITYKNGIYELPHELPNYLRLRILGN